MNCANCDHCVRLEAKEVCDNPESRFWMQNVTENDICDEHKEEKE